MRISFKVLSRKDRHRKVFAGFLIVLGQDTKKSAIFDRREKKEHSSVLGSI